VRMPGRLITQVIRRTRLVRRSRTDMVCMTWQVMYGSGHQTGMQKTITGIYPVLTPRAHRGEARKFSAAGRGTLIQPVRNLHSAISTTQLRVMLVTASVVPSSFYHHSSSTGNPALLRFALTCNWVTWPMAK
jgi:hypothetical protein